MLIAVVVIIAALICLVLMVVAHSYNERVAGNKRANYRVVGPHAGRAFHNPGNLLDKNGRPLSDNIKAVRRIDDDPANGGHTYFEAA